MFEFKFRKAILPSQGDEFAQLTHVYRGFGTGRPIAVGPTTLSTSLRRTVASLPFCFFGLSALSVVHVLFGPEEV